MRVLAAFLALLVAAFIAGALDAAQQGVDMRMVDAGFIMRPADTARKLERLKLLPPRKFVARTRGGRRYFLYADPDLCKCLFVGNENALNAYRNMTAEPAQPGNVAPSGVVPDTMLIGDVDSNVEQVMGDDDYFANSY
jgi:hypothetical protein